MNLSPYGCSIEELSERFCTSPRRKSILERFLKLRGELLATGMQGFQWVDGSFVEDVETMESRDPRDVDVVTFVTAPDKLAEVEGIKAANPHFCNNKLSKQMFQVDHFLVPLCSSPRALVEITRYWYGLFSHRRDGTWKGMLVVELSSALDDKRARKVLETKP